jgi:hypothetical protein
MKGLVSPTLSPFGRSKGVGGLGGSPERSDGIETMIPLKESICIR